MKTIDKKKTLIIIGILIIVVILAIVLLNVIRKQEKDVTIGKNKDISLSSCATVTVNKEIKLKGKALTREEALSSEPYTFKVESSCKKTTGYNIFVVTKEEKFEEKNIRYILTNKGDKTVIKEGVLGELNNMIEVFSSDNIRNINRGINGKVKTAYMIYNEFVPEKEISYDLYLYVDKEITKKEEIEGTYEAGITLNIYEVGE